MAETKIYNLRIVPPSPVYEEVLAFKDSFIKTFGKQTYSKSKPHITLAQFQMHTENEPYLLQYLSEFSNLEKFKMQIEGFYTFISSKALILKVSDSENFSNLIKQMKVIWVRDLHRKPNTLITSNTPHITISKTKNLDMLQKSLEFFKSEAYVKTFNVDHLLLVSRYDYKTWDSEYRIDLTALND
ncbi:2'-5' RNA ligase family protein [Aestuariibaculum marinum]|uniref:2'-5' RNA ligase family protein n=1 Tax=Aestuariibaculum marinum TaxID=2683592 RepID=A0A8J6U6G3_9FLAO|nr:2'-5' RNA ligase family protein [Aestuariibaculum marinum]MBD0822731.1 2'-5' RNA ligase family protein [Aestuariibaculum marinum]